MSRVILQPAGNPDGREHYNDTIENQVVLLQDHRNLRETSVLQPLPPSLAHWQKS